MSVTFSVRGERINWDDPEPGSFLNLSNANAADLCRWLAITGEYGEYQGRELAAICRARLANPLYGDPEIPAAETKGERGCRCIYGGRAEGYLAERTQQLLALCERAGDLGYIVYG